MFRSTIADQERDFVMAVRDLVQNYIAPKAIEYDSRGDASFDWSAVNMLAQHNLMAPNVPQEYGGLGLCHITTAMVLEEIAAACAGVATVVLTNLHAISPILTAGTEEQKKEFLPLVCGNNPKLGSTTIIEHKPNLDIIAQPETMDIRSSSVNAEDINEGNLVLKGTKDYVMNGSIASFTTIMLSTTLHGDKSGLQIAVLPMDTPGIVVGKYRKTLGLKYCPANEIVFDNVKLNEKYFIGKPGSGFLVFMQNLDRMAPLAGALSLGVARAAYETALEAAQKRMFMGKPSFEESAVSFALADMATKLNAARQSVHFACWLIDREGDYSQASSKAKIISSSVAQEVSNRAMEIVGGRAYLYGNQSEKYLRDAKMLSIIDGSEQFHRNLVASQLY